MRKLHRLYVNCELTPGEQHTLSSDSSNYLCNVLRHGAGHNIQCFNGLGTEAICTILPGTKRETLIRVDGTVSKSNNNTPKLHLAIGLLKGQPMDRAIQQSTELGATDIWLLQSDRSNVQLDEKRMAKKSHHWRQVSISSCQQCGETFLPSIHGPTDIQSVFQNTQSAEKMIFDPKGSLLDKELNPKERILFIGPEGGWSASERAYFESQKASFFSLGKRILRAENSPGVALALVSHAQNLS